MRSGSYQHSSYTHRTSPRRRAVALAAAIAANVLLILLLLGLAPAFRPPPPQPEPAIFRLLPDARNNSADATPAKAKRAGGTAARKPSSRPAASVARPPAPTNLPLNMIALSRDEYAASDISKLPSHSEDRAQQSANAAGSGTGQASGAGDGKGAGPNGETLYEADWYRRPTHAELATYLPADAPANGWGVIACQTVARYHVDNCRELADSPSGSGLARAVREAAWQFLVMPPRINGRPIIGAWVRIRIEYTATSIR